MRFFRKLREHLHISTKTVIYVEMMVLSLLCLSIFLFKTDPGQAVMSQASRLAGYMNPLENIDGADPDKTGTDKKEAKNKDYIKWVDFTVSYEALCQAYDWDVDTFDTEHHVEWIPLLAYTAARTGGEFDKKALKILNETSEKLAEGEAEIETLTKDMKYYPYYLEAYSAALGGLVGEYEAEVIGEDGQSTWQKKIRIKRLLPHCERI